MNTPTINEMIAQKWLPVMLWQVAELCEINASSNNKSYNPMYYFELNAVSIIRQVIFMTNEIREKVVSLGSL